MKKSIGITTCLALLFLACGDIYSQDWPQFRGLARDCKVNGFKAPATWPSMIDRQWVTTVGFGDASPVLVGDMIYLNTRQGNNEVTLCLDAKTGKEIWKDSNPASAVTGPAASHPGPRGTPAVASGKIVTFGATGILSCLDAATGDVVWRKVNPDGVVPQFFTGMSPVIVENTCIVHSGTKDKGSICAIDLNTGKTKWFYSSDEGPSYASPSIMNFNNNKHIIVQTEKNILSMNFAYGQILWQVATPLKNSFYNCTSTYIKVLVIYFSGKGSGTKAIVVSLEGN
jgi:outer membrane protein assembly factor BamB